MTFVKIKQTPARVAITDYLYSTSFPVSVDEIIGFLRKRNLNTNKVTVYRIIEYLYKNGILEKLEFGEGKFRYEVKKGHHHHLICTNCGKVEDVEGDFVSSLEAKIRKQNGFLVKSHALEFYGLCTNCQK